MTDPKTKKPKKEPFAPATKKAVTQEPTKDPAPDLSAKIIHTVLKHGDDQKLPLMEALGSLQFAALELYVASKAGPQTPVQPEGVDKTEEA